MLKDPRLLQSSPENYLQGSNSIFNNVIQSTYNPSSNPVQADKRNDRVVTSNNTIQSLSYNFEINMQPQKLFQTLKQPTLLQPVRCDQKFSREFLEKFNLNPSWLVLALSGQYYMDKVFKKESISYFVPDSTDFIVYEFIKKGTKKRSKLFECTFKNCNKFKVSSSKFFQHAISHSKDKPYACSYTGCDYTCGYIGNLRVHQAEIHNETPVEHIVQK